MKKSSIVEIYENTTGRRVAMFSADGYDNMFVNNRIVSFYRNCERTFFYDDRQCYHKVIPN